MSDSNFVLCARNVVKRNGETAFGAEPGRTRYLEVPDNTNPHPKLHEKKKADWVRSVIARANRGPKPNPPFRGYSVGDILVFVHGYNNSPDDVMHRHNLLQKRLREKGFRGAIVSFDWPSDSSALNYREDKRDAKETARRLVDDGIAILATNQLQQDRRKCGIDVHLLAHSMGAFVVREAFSEADETRSVAMINWRVSQVAFVAADVDQESLSRKDPRSRAPYVRGGLVVHTSRQY